MGLLGRRNKRSRSKPPSSEFTNTPPLRTSQTQPPPPVPPVPPVPTLPPSSQREGTPSPFVGQPFESVGRNNGSFGSPGSTVGRGSAGQYQVGPGNSSVVQHSPERTRFGSVNGSFDEFGARDDRRRGSAQGQGGRNTIRQPPLPPQPPAHQQPGLPDNDISRQLNSFHFPRTSSPSHRGSSTSSLSSGSSSTTAAGTYPGSPLARIRKDSITLRKEAQRNAELRVSAPRARLPSRDLPDFSNTVSSPITSTGNPSNPLGPPLSFSIHTPIPPPQMKSFPFPQIKPLVRSLEHSLKNDGKRIRDYIEVEELVSGRLWDREDQEGLKDCGDGKKKKVFALQEAEKEWKERERQRHVFGGHLKTVAECTAMPFPIYGYIHELPNVVLSCVEEIRRTGIDERGLFNIPPHNDRLTTLIARFDQPFLDSTRPLPDLRRESIHDICALLSTFLRSLPAPLFHRSFFDAMWAWCVNPTLIREAENHKLFRRKNRKTDYGDLEAQIDNTSSSSSEDDAVEGFGGLPSFNSRRRKQRKKDREIEKARWKSYVLAHPEALEQHRSEKHEKRLRLERELYALETHQIAVSRLILLLLSQPSFSLLIYLLTFFNELLQHTQNNRLNYDKLGGMFGFKLLGGPSQGAAKIALCWLITRWGRIVEGFKSEDSRIACRRKLELEGKTEEEFSVPPVGRDSRFNIDPGENLRASKEQLPVSRAMTRKRSGSVTSSRRSSVSRSSSLSQEAREINDRAVQEQKRRASEPTSVRNCMLFDDAPRGRGSGSRSAEFEDTLILEPFGAEGSNGKAEKRYGEDPRVYGRKKRGVEDERDSGVGRSDSGESGGGKGEHQRAAFSAIQHLLQSESGSDGEHASNPAYDPDNSSTYSEDYSDGGCRPLEIVPPVIPASRGRHMGEHTEGSDVVELKRELEIARRERDQAMKKLEKMRQAFEDAARI